MKVLYSLKDAAPSVIVEGKGKIYGDGVEQGEWASVRSKILDKYGSDHEVAQKVIERLDQVSGFKPQEAAHTPVAKAFEKKEEVSPQEEDVKKNETADAEKEEKKEIEEEKEEVNLSYETKRY